MPGDAPVYMVDHPWVAERQIHIPHLPLIDALTALSTQFVGLQLEYRARDAEEGQRRVGPIAGTLGPEVALQQIEKQLESGLRHRRVGPYAFMLETSDEEGAAYERRYLYGRSCACPVRVEQVLSETVTVVKPAIFERVGESVVTYTRKQIESTGAATLPQFFRYLSLNAYSRPEGYIASGAQYADFRGLGRDTHLVTINGRRTLPSANNVTSSAFDLNTTRCPPSSAWIFACTQPRCAQALMRSRARSILSPVARLKERGASLRVCGGRGAGATGHLQCGSSSERRRLRHVV